MALAAELPGKDIGHDHVVGAFLGHEGLFVALLATEPLRMSLVRERHRRHVLGVGQDDVEIEQLHGAATVEPGARLNCTRIEGLYPVNEVARLAGRQA